MNPSMSATGSRFPARRAGAGGCPPHAPQQLQQPGTRVHADVGQREWTIGCEALRHQWQRCRGETRRHRLPACRAGSARLSIAMPGAPLVRELHFFEGAPSIRSVIARARAQAPSRARATARGKTGQQSRIADFTCALHRQVRRMPCRCRVPRISTGGRPCGYGWMRALPSSAAATRSIGWRMSDSSPG